MAKALIGHLPGPDLTQARLVADNSSLRARVGALTSQVAELEEALAAANAVADGRLVDLVETSGGAQLEVALRQVTESAHA